jgi:hypothetical protein
VNQTRFDGVSESQFGGRPVGISNQAPVVVATTSMTTEASVITSLLEGYNIPCRSSSEFVQRLWPACIFGSAAIRIYVPASLAKEAQRILMEHRRRRHLHLVEI